MERVQEGYSGRGKREGTKGKTVERVKIDEKEKEYHGLTLSEKKLLEASKILNTLNFRSEM